MGIEKRPEIELDEEALEASLPTLTKKLRELESELTEDERAVFSGIVNSAAMHLQSIQAIGDNAEIRYEKPISAAATASVRQHMLGLPETLGLTARK